VEVHPEGPIEQFKVVPIIPIKIGGIDFSFTNASLFMLLTLLVVSGFLLLGTRRQAVIPSRLQSSVELVYDFVHGTMREILGKHGAQFFPLVFTLFLFILTLNLWGMFPYFYTATALPVVTIALTILVWGLVVVYGFYRNGLGFLRLFVTPGIPVYILPVIVVIEVFSFFARLLSLSLRLFANMLAGHITLKVFAGFVIALGSLGFLGWGGAVIALLTTVALTALEFLVAGLQAYVFAMLTCIYLNDAFHPSH
jgi:F-type H+-transporting ATPase subunit a